MELEKLLKPLRLESKQGCLNRSVSRGLDRYVVLACEDLARRFSSQETPAAVSAAAELQRLRREFTQYLTLDPGQRQRLVSDACLLIERWLADPGKTGWEDPPPLPRPGNDAPSSAAADGGSAPIRPDPGRGKARVALDASLTPLVPRDKQRAFQRLGLRTVGDLLRFAPKWVVHRSLVVPLAVAGEDREPVFLKGRIRAISRSRHGTREMVKVILEDGSGLLSWVWFNRPYLQKEWMNGRWVLLHAAPETSRWGRQLIGEAGQYEFLSAEEEKVLESGGTLVFYPSTPTLDQPFWRDLFAGILDAAVPQVPDLLASRIGSPLLTLTDALRSVHRPLNPEAYEAGRQRLALDELMTMQMTLILKRRRIESLRKDRTYRFDGPRVKAFRESIPFPLTGAQQRVLKQIREDLGRPSPMNRLLQGDVGSGKTVVALIAFLYGADSGFQGALLAPTEILAEQHHRTLESMAGPCGLKSVLVTGDMKVRERRAVLKALEDGTADVAVGTQALLEEGVRFRRLGIAVMDERHKFGVLQRAALEGKGSWPDTLMMTATPFPRALVLTEYGDTDLSLLDEMPAGRKPVRTVWRGESRHEEVTQFVRERVLAGEQAFLVYPAVDESKASLKSATRMFQVLKDRTFHGFPVGLIHGRMKKEEKARVMASFRDREILILVSTTVVEVGMDVSNATVMVVEHAERFGLAQLHQLRGRVGRGTAQGYCFLLTSGIVSASAVERVKAMTSTNDGFQLSETDLRIRGPGEIFGLAQSGRREGGLVDLRRDGPIVERARGVAQAILEKDPLLSSEANADLRRFLREKYREEIDLAALS